MPFIINHSGRNKVDVRRAEKLKRRLAKNQLLRKEPSFRNWVLEFEKLREYGDRYNIASPEQIDVVLKWYCRNLGKAGIPDARSAGAFRKRFREIEKAMQITRGDSDGVRIRSDVKQFIKEYMPDIVWPGDSAERLPAAVQASSDNHAIMVDRLETFVEPWSDKLERDWPLEVMLAFDILADHQEATTFILSWFGWVHRQVRRWNDWSGSFRPFVFHVEHRRFRSSMAYKASTVIGDPVVWDNLLKEIQ